MSMFSSLVARLWVTAPLLSTGPGRGSRPYGDIYMEVAEPFRSRGLGSFLVQELKRVCYEGGNVPGARCNPRNVASRKTLQKAGFVPCGHILNGSVAHDPGRR
jgi:GNAT superfamily N-acetyltransferase